MGTAHPTVCLAAVVGLALALTSGCSRRDPIREYVVPKAPVAGTLWFFKLIGAKEAVTARTSELKAFAESVRFDLATGVPQWTLPTGWTEELPANGFRYRTVKIPGENPLEIAVTQTAGTVPPTADDLRNQANQLRPQVGLSELGETDDAHRLEAAGELAWLSAGPFEGHLFKFTGKTNQFGDTQLLAAVVGSPFRPEAKPDTLASGEGRAASEVENPFTYTAPELWKEAPQTTFSVVSLAVSDGSKNASITVTPAMGGLLPNVNRWRGQAGLEPLEDEGDLTANSELIKSGSLQMLYVEAVGQERAILGGMLQAGGRLWFVKLDGDPDLAARERERFREFLKSFKVQ